MDQQTALVCRNRWGSIINASLTRPKDTSVKQWLQDNSISANVKQNFTSFYNHTNEKVRGTFSLLLCSDWNLSP